MYRYCNPNFARERGGSVSMVFALALIVILGCVGLALDYGNSIRTRAHLQSALDAAVLAASNASVDDKDRQTKFRTAFTSNYGTRFEQPSKVTYQFSAQDRGGTAAGSVPMNTSFMKALGFSDVTVSAVSAAKFEDVDIEVVMALDMSGSMHISDMGGGMRIDALKAAAHKLVDLMVAAKSSRQTIKFGMVPFNMAVNIGTDNADLVFNTSHALFTGTTWGGCVLERPGSFASTDDYTGNTSGKGAGKWPAYIWPPEANTGTVGRLLNPSNGTNSGYASLEAEPLGQNSWRPGPNFNCPRKPLTRLTTSDSTIHASIDALFPYSNLGTTIAPAVGWGLRLLSPTGPFKDGAAFSKRTRKFLIVVTDGDLVTDGWYTGGRNSVTPYRFDPASLGLAGRVLTRPPSDNAFTPYGYLLDSDPYNSGLYSQDDENNELDRLALVACTTAKNRSSSYPIEVFTIAASAGAGPGSRAQALLTQCATSSDHFIYAADSTALEAAFKNIADRAMGLRLTQ